MWRRWLGRLQIVLAICSLPGAVMLIGMFWALFHHDSVFLVQQPTPNQPIAVIGGEDGPTSYWVTSDNACPVLCTALALCPLLLVLLTLTLALWDYFRKLQEQRLGTTPR